MTSTEFKVGDTVQPANRADMLTACDTYHTFVTHGIVTDVDTHYHASISVQWVNGDRWPTMVDSGPQNITYTMPPAMLRPASEVTV